MIGPRLGPESSGDFLVRGSLFELACQYFSAAASKNRSGKGAKGSQFQGNLARLFLSVPANGDSLGAGRGFSEMRKRPSRVSHLASWPGPKDT
jgi:hypothetical protein